MLAWIGVLLLAAGSACQIEMARLKRIGTDQRSEAKENSPAESRATVAHSITYRERYSAVIPYRNGLLATGGGLLLFGLLLPSVRVRTKRHLVLTAITATGSLSAASLSVSTGGSAYSGAGLGLFSWYLAQWVVRTLNWDRPKNRSALRKNKDRDAEFLRHRKSGGMEAVMIAAWAKFAKLDGSVSRDELDVVERWMKAMRFSSESRLKAIATFRDAKTGPASFWETVVELTGWNSEPYRPFKGIFIFGLFDLAHADGEMSPRVEDLLRDVCDLHGVPFEKWSRNYQELRPIPDGVEDFVASLLGFDSDSENGREQTIPQEAEMAYATLGCLPTDSDDTVRDRYRNLARAFHPDALSAKGLSAELLRVAEEKFTSIQAAYDVIRQTRNAVASEHTSSL